MVVSPAKCNLDESMSTLEYAHRAKNIRNKPEINQKMTKRALIREYITEIERLKSDLLATREKNGVYLAGTSYELLIEENESRKTRVEEITKEIQAKEEMMKIHEANYKEAMILLDESNEKVDFLDSELDLKEQELAKSVDQLQQTEQRLCEQEILTRLI